MADKDRTQDELFVLFNFLIESGRQMIFTSAVPLSELTGVEARLRTRLEGGLVVDLPAPDREIRQQVLERLLAGEGGRARRRAGGLSRLPAGGSVRAVHGLLQRVLNAAESQGGRTDRGARARGAGGAGAQAVRAVQLSTRSSGIVAPASGARSREKMVWDWPDVGDRIVEEWR